MAFDSTIKLIREQHYALVEVIQYLDRTKQSNTEIREKVDKILNHEEKLYKDSDMELTKITLINT